MSKIIATAAALAMTPAMAAAKGKGKTEPQDEPQTQDESKQEPEVKAPKQSGKPPTDVRREPNPNSKKYKIFSAGRDGNKGSVKALANETNTTESNIRQHIAQCHTVHGFGYTMSGDEFTIDGDITESWADQLKVKAEAKAVKDAEKAKEKPADPEGAGDKTDSDKTGDDDEDGESDFL